ncbi:hypothetical protein EB230_17400 [Mesorhizobium sp. NZP2234]|uniref:hypothetical protein n=1 Tax=Mesorhizobium sp. NZP2234 TaxID=2483402 RepID=UPI001557D4E6|nr:hypothetical protein [Mesorhizobium sp. NZP2234]QKC89985.1 hypothetical protein EB230_17400 [Mesorhizobium sp. NZP2234]
MNAAGYCKITAIEIERFREPVQKIDGYGLPYWSEETTFGHVVIVAEGAVFYVSTLKGETEEGNAARYRVGGYTDDRCIYDRLAEVKP